jgi:hypothetical protein
MQSLQIISRPQTVNLNASELYLIRLPSSFSKNGSNLIIDLKKPLAETITCCVLNLVVNGVLKCEYEPASHHFSTVANDPWTIYRFSIRENYTIGNESLLESQILEIVQTNSGIESPNFVSLLIGSLINDEPKKKNIERYIIAKMLRSQRLNMFDVQSENFFFMKRIHINASPRYDYAGLTDILETITKETIHNLSFKRFSETFNQLVIDGLNGLVTKQKIPVSNDTQELYIKSKVSNLNLNASEMYLIKLPSSFSVDGSYKSKEVEKVLAESITCCTQNLLIHQVLAYKYTKGTHYLYYKDCAIARENESLLENRIIEMLQYHGILDCSTLLKNLVTNLISLGDKPYSVEKHVVINLLKNQKLNLFNTKYESVFWGQRITIMESSDYSYKPINETLNTIKTEKYHNPSFVQFSEAFYKLTIKAIRAKNAEWDT